MTNIPLTSSRMEHLPGNEDWIKKFAENTLETKESASKYSPDNPDPMDRSQDIGKSPLAGGETIVDNGAGKVDAGAPEMAPPEEVAPPEPIETETPDATLASEVAKELTEMASIISTEVSQVLQMDADSLAELSQSDPRFQPLHAQFSTLQGVIGGFAQTLSEMSETIIAPTATMAPPSPIASSDREIITATILDRLKGSWEGLFQGKSSMDNDKSKINDFTNEIDEKEKNKIVNAVYAELQQKIQKVIGSLAGLSNRISMLKSKATGKKGGDPNVKAAVAGIDAEFKKVQQAANAVADVLKVPDKVPDAPDAPDATPAATDPAPAAAPAPAPEAVDPEVAEPEVAVPGKVAPGKTSRVPKLPKSGTPAAAPAPAGAPEAAPAPAEAEAALASQPATQEGVLALFDQAVKALVEAAGIPEGTEIDQTQIKPGIDAINAAFKQVKGAIESLKMKVPPAAPAEADPAKSEESQMESGKMEARVTNLPSNEEKEGMKATVIQVENNDGMKASVSKHVDDDIVEFAL